MRQKREGVSWYPRRKEEEEGMRRRERGGGGGVRVMDGTQEVRVELLER